MRRHDDVGRCIIIRTVGMRRSPFNTPSGDLCSFGAAVGMNLAEDLTCILPMPIVVGPAVRR